MRTLRLAALLSVALTLAGAAALDASAGRAQDRVRVVLVSSGCAGSSSICAPFKRALRRTGVSGRVISPDIREDPVGTLSLLAGQGYDLVIADLTNFDALAAVAPRFPKTTFALFDGPLSWLGGPSRNVEAIVHEPNEAAYLAGWLAARMEQRRPGKDVVGAVGGISAPPVDDFIFGFRAGARAADPGITVLTKYSNDFADPNKCEAIARSFIAQGAGVVFNVAGFCGQGALRAAKAAGVWGTGVDADQAGLGAYILTSVLKGYEAGFVKLLEQVRDGRILTGRTTVLTLADGGADLGRISPKVSPALRAELDRVRARILAGQIHVPLAPRH